MVSVTHVAREILPPVLTRLLRPPRRYGPWGHYPSWQAAEAEATSCGPYSPPLDDVEGTIRGQFEPPCFHGVHLAAILSLPAPVTVLDFGGGMALAYFRAMRTVPERIKSWKVVELPVVADHGRRLPNAPGLSFHTSIDEALDDGDRPDIVTCSSVLQTMEDAYGALTKLFSVGAKRIVLDRIPLEPQERISLFHTVRGDKIPWRIISGDFLTITAEKRGYRVLYQQRHTKHPTAEAASEEYCILYVGD